MNRLKERLDPVLKTFVARGPAGCSLRVDRAGEPLYVGCEGYADLETKKPVTPDTIFRIYSMSKVITCTAALMLHERGLFALNDPLADYLPEFRDPQVYRQAPDGTLYASPASGPILVKHLFMMASGLTYPDKDVETGRKTGKALDRLRKTKPDFTLRDFTKTIAEIPLAFDPGTHWRYGLSHDVLGAFIEALSGKRFGQFLKDEIFDPLGMPDTSFRISEGKRSRLASVYDLGDGGKLTKNTSLDTDFQPDATHESGGGGLLSTLADYSRLEQALAIGELGGVRLLSDHTIRLMATDHLNDQLHADFNWTPMAGYGYGLGVRVMVDPAAGGSNSSVGEFGWMGMLGTLGFIDPKEKLTIVFMKQLMPNQEGYHLPIVRNTVYGAL